MMKKNFALLCLFFCVLQACDRTPAETTASTETANVPATVDFDWLAGNWQGKIEDGDYFESWERTGEKKYAGTGFLLANSDTLMKEFVTLEQVNGNWAYQVRVGSAAPVAFLLVDSALANSFVFENKKHDFPQQIIYTKLSGEKLAAVISGPIEGKIVTEEFTLYRIKP